MSLPWRAKTVIAAVVLGGLAVFGAALADLATNGPPGRDQLVVIGVFSALVLVSWVKPLIVYIGQQSEAVQLDEAFFVILVLLAPVPETVIAYGLATVASQVIQRRPLVKSVFNSGQVLLSVGAGIGVFNLLAHNGPLDYERLGAAVLATVAYSLANSLSVQAILVATGLPFREVLLDGLGVRAAFDVAGMAVGLSAAVTVASHLWALPVAIIPIVVLRQVLVGHFQARHDRARFEGLYEATLDINRSMGTEDVERSMAEAARGLLRGSEARLSDKDSESDHGADANSLRTVFTVAERQLALSVSGRSRTEPFDPTDEALLGAIAAVGATALSKASLYEESRLQRQRLAAITSSLGEGVCAVNSAGRITFVNPAACAMLGWDTEGDGPNHLDSGIDVGPSAPTFIAAPAMRSMANRDTITSYEARFQRADGSFFPVAFTAAPIVDATSEAADQVTATEGMPSGAVLVFRDITERKLMEEQLARHAFHDALTGLPNRRLFLDHLEHAMWRAKRSGETHAVLFADIDRFKYINDSLGHHAGDQLLMAIGERLRAALRPGDVLARLGGDEFTVLLEGVSSNDDAIAVAQRILREVSKPISLPEGHEVVATVSIGIATASTDKTRDDVLHDADVAMYQAKARGRGGHYEVFDIDAMGVRSAERIELESALRRALENDELEAFYQPLFSLPDQSLVGAEALVRWHHPVRGLLGADEFIELAEDTGLILPLGRAMLEKACRQARRWRDELGVSLSIGVNLSARQFQQASLVEEIQDVLQATGVPASQLLFEITESLALERIERTIETLLQLKALGCKVAIDDFGRGYSSLVYLADFPVDVVKVDRAFINGVDVDPVKSAIVSAVVTLSKAIGATTVVEGVETRQQFEHLTGLGCRVAQGFLFGRPVPADRFERDFLGAAGHPELLEDRALA